MLRIITNISECVGRLLITHTGRFHADEVFATVILYLAFSGDVSLLRTDTPPERIKIPHTVYDVGAEQGYTRYDHHQRGGNGVRKNGVPYASAGLVWRSFGTFVLMNHGIPDKYINNIWKKIDNVLIQPIDALDNGQRSPNKQGYSESYTLTHVISAFNPTCLETTASDEAFLKAFEVAKEIFIRELEKAKARAFSADLVEEAIEKSENRIMILEQWLPWEGAVAYSENPKAAELLYVISPSNRSTGYVVIAVKADLESGKPRKAFPEAWGGLPAKALRAITGIETIHFCHTGRFIAGTVTLEDAKKLATIAANYEERILYLKEG